MKKTIAIFIALAGAFTATMPLMADTETVNGITWTYTVSDGKASVGGGSHSTPAVSTATTGAITIPSALGGYYVTSIDQCAFNRCGGLTSVTIPNGVTSIGNWAFNECSGLTNITILANDLDFSSTTFYGCGGLAEFVVEESNTAFSVRDGLLLSKDGKTLVQGVNGNVIIPEGVTKIGECAFYGRSGLTSVAIPASVTNIESGDFGNCEALAEITVDEGNAAYASFDGALYDKRLTTLVWCPNNKMSLKLPDSVTDMGMVLQYNYNLISLIISSSGQNIYNFALPPYLRDIYIKTDGYGLPSVDESVFQNLNNEITVFVDYDSYVDRVWSGFTLKKAPEWWSDGCSFSLFGGVLTITSEYTSSHGITITASSELEEVCDRVYEIEIGEGINAIGDEAFIYFCELRAVKIPEGVKSIGSRAFYYANNLNSIQIPSSVTRIGEDAFAYCYGLGSGVISIDNCLIDTDPGRANKTYSGLPEGTRLIAGGTLKNCIDLTTAIIPDSVKYIGKNAFGNCVNLKNITIPAGVEYIEESAFPSWTRVTVADGNSLYREMDGAIYCTTNGVCVWGPKSKISIISTSIREDNPSILDVSYIVRSPTDKNEVWPLAYLDGGIYWSKIVRPETFATTPDGTASIFGENAPSFVTNTISWNVAADYTNDLAKFSIVLYAKPDGLLPLDLITLPAEEEGSGLLEVSVNTLTPTDIDNALLWLFASGDAALSLKNGVLYDGDTRLSSCELQADYLFRKMGYQRLTKDNHLDYVNTEAKLSLSPSGARQYAVRAIPQ